MKSICWFAVSGFLLLSNGSLFGQPKLEEIVKKVEVSVEPKEAKPGQLVSVKVRVELDPAWSTYPTVQSDKGAASQTNRFVQSKSGIGFLVGKPIDPPNPTIKSEPLLGIDQLAYYPGGGTFEHPVIISPKATAGAGEIKFTLKMLICDKDNCLPPEKFDLSTKIKILEGPAVEIDSKYKTEVEKLLQK